MTITLTGLQMVVLLLGAVVGFGTQLFWMGWWASKLGSKMERLAEKLDEHRAATDNRYLNLERNLEADHKLLRELEIWKASGLLLELNNLTYPKSTVDRLVGELKTEVEGLHGHVEELLERRRVQRGPATSSGSGGSGGSSTVAGSNS